MILRGLHLFQSFLVVAGLFRGGSSGIRLCNLFWSLVQVAASVVIAAVGSAGCLAALKGVGESLRGLGCRAGLGQCWCWSFHRIASSHQSDSVCS